MKFVDTNIFIYSIMDHSRFGSIARRILERIESGEDVFTSTLVLCEVAWLLEAMGRQNLVRSTLEKILSYDSLRVVTFDYDDVVAGASYMMTYQIDFNDGVTASVMSRLGVNEAYSNDVRHLGKVDFLTLIFH